MILPYIIKSAMALALLYACIVPLLEKETFHRLNRILIIGCLILFFVFFLFFFFICSFHRSYKSDSCLCSAGGAVAGGTDKRQCKRTVRMELGRHHNLYIYNRYSGNILNDSSSDRASD